MNICSYAGTAKQIGSVKKKGGDEICVNAKCAEKKVVGWKPITKSLGVLWFVGTAGQSYTTKTA